VRQCSGDCDGWRVEVARSVEELELRSGLVSVVGAETEPVVGGGIPVDAVRSAALSPTRLRGTIPPPIPRTVRSAWLPPLSPSALVHHFSYIQFCLRGNFIPVLTSSSSYDSIDLLLAYIRKLQPVHQSQRSRPHAFCAVISHAPAHFCASVGDDERGSRTLQECLQVVALYWCSLQLSVPCSTRTDHETN
jgi:hypothetical protein